MTGHFIDRVKIEVSSGKGGDGCVSFRREKHVPRGGPDGGNGGDGGDVIMRVNPHLRTLIDFRYGKIYRAGNGKPGSGARKTGKSGDPVIIEVPPGTVVQDSETGKVLADLTEEDQSALILKGGKGGRGNYTFRRPTDRASRRATGGEPGKEKNLQLTMKLIADVGTVGFPNAGKSTLLSAVSGAHPKIASYPFTTLTPTLGIVRVGELASFCMVDIPGLIKGAHRGKGLGIQFLQHIERCRVLLLVIDASGEDEVVSVRESLLRELELYSDKLLDRPRVIALNKIDLMDDAASLRRYSDILDEEVFPISAVTSKGLGDLISRLHEIIIGTKDQR